MKNNISIVNRDKVPDRKELVRGINWSKYIGKLTDGKAIKVVVADKKIANIRRLELIGAARPIKLQTAVVQVNGNYVLYAWKRE